MNKILIIPDIHGRTFWKKAYELVDIVDKVVFLGDYLDSYSHENISPLNSSIMSCTRKIINDPVFGFLNIPDGVLFTILQHPYIQRLNRIRQLGLSFFVYPGAMHSRFLHSLGAMHLMHEAITSLREKGVDITDNEATAAMAAILLLAPRILKEPVFCRFSHLRYTLPPLMAEKVEEWSSSVW